MKVKTTRFGELQVGKEDILIFHEGILGFDTLKKFFIVDPNDTTLILWLQSIEDGSVAFPILEPKIFSSDYFVKLLPSEMSILELADLNHAKIYSILTIPSDVTKMSANLKAPVIINAQVGKGKQVVLQDNKLSVKYEMYKELKKHIVTYSSNDSTRSQYQIDSTNKEKIVNEMLTNETKSENLSPRRHLSNSTP